MLGVGLGGLELSTIMPDAIGNSHDITLIDNNDSFVFGFSKLNVMFNRLALEAVHIAYLNIKKSVVRSASLLFSEDVGLLFAIFTLSTNRG